MTPLSVYISTFYFALWSPFLFQLFGWIPLGLGSTLGQWSLRGFLSARCWWRFERMEGWREGCLGARRLVGGVLFYVRLLFW